MKTRVIESEEEKFEIINKCDFCRIGLAGPEGIPYVIPMCFAFDGNYLYLHAGPTGKKIDILKENNRICAEFSTDYQMFYQHEQVACSYGINYRSVLLYGNVEFIEDFTHKKEILNKIMQKYAGKSFSYNDPAIRNVCVMRILPVMVEGKVHGYK